MRSLARMAMLVGLLSIPYFAYGQSTRNENPDPSEYLLFYNVTRDATFAADTIEGEILAAKKRVDLEKQLFDMQHRLFERRAVSAEEYENKKNDYEIAQKELEKRKQRKQLWESISKINSFRTVRSSGESIDLKKFYNMNVDRWTHECAIFQYDADIHKLTRDLRRREFHRRKDLYHRNASSLEDLLLAKFYMEESSANFEASVKLTSDCQKSIPTWEEIKKIDDERTPA